MPRQGVMLAKPFVNERQLRNWPYVILQPKLNGVRCRATATRMVSSQANQIIAFPHLQNAICEMLNGKDWELDGEIFSFDLSFQVMSGMARAKNYLPSICVPIRFVAFDIINNSYQEDRINQLSTLKLAKDGLFFSEPIESTTCVTSANDVIDSFFEKCIASGYEGIILRNPEALYQTKRTGDLLKIKASFTDTFKVIGLAELIHQDGSRGGTMGAIRCVTDKMLTFNVGSGFLRCQRNEIWDAFTSKESKLPFLLKVRYAGLTDRKIPFHPIAKEVIW